MKSKDHESYTFFQINLFILNGKIQMPYSNSLVKLIVFEVNTLCSFELLVEDAKSGNDVRRFEAVSTVDLRGRVGRVQGFAKESSL